MILGIETIYSYFLWHYFEIPKEIFKVIKNFLKFCLYYFSIPFLLKTFFSHWHRYSWSYPRSFSIGIYFEVFLSNLISRIFGAIFRFILILIGIFFEILILIFGITVFFLWLFLPIILFFGLIYGFRFLFKI